MAERILNIDDNDAGRYATSRILQRGGFIAIEATSGEEGWQKALHEEPDLILLDVNLPDINGFDVCRRLKADPRTASIPVLMMSASFVAKVDQVKGLEGGADGYLTEPLEPEVLTAHIRALLRMRQAELQMQEARREAEEANRAKDHFLAVLSHELRTPLNPALAAIELLNDYDLPDDVRSLSDVIRRNLLLEARLIDDLLDVTRIVRGKLQMNPGHIDLHALVADVIDICRNDITIKNQQLSLDLAAEYHAIHADAARMQQVIWNIVKNAVKFTPAGGSIDISTSNPAPGMVQLRVTDSGIGIEAHLMAHIFNAFDQGDESTNRQFGGLGLGLAISKSIVDAHNGTLSVNSDGSGTGATFFLELPLEEAPETSTSNPTANIPAERKESDHSLRVLVVDDHADTNEMIRMLLERRGFVVFSAHDLSSARAIIDGHTLDILITDIGLPDGSGLELMKALGNRNVRGIAVSGYGMSDDLERSQQAGFQAHLTKPIALEKLIEELEKIRRDYV